MHKGEGRGSFKSVSQCIYINICVQGGSNFSQPDEYILHEWPFIALTKITEVDKLRETLNAV